MLDALKAKYIIYTYLFNRLIEIQTLIEKEGSSLAFKTFMMNEKRLTGNIKLPITTGCERYNFQQKILVMIPEDK